MREIIEQNLEVGEYYFRDNDCAVYISKTSCGHYTVSIVGIIGITGMHYSTIEDVINSPFDLDKFVYTKYKENQILSVEPIDKI